MELAALRDAARGAPGEGHEVVDVGHIAVRVGRALAARYADARALIDSGNRIFDATVIEDQLERLVALPEELSPIATPRQRGAERLTCFARADRRPACDCCGDDRPPLP
jgi:chloramphenicol 3-O-phosphotransferase